MLYRILVYGDDHMDSKDYGQHQNYPKESLWCFNKINEIITEENIDICIGLGDLTNGAFTNLSYRKSFEELLAKRNELTKNHFYMIRGNHDKSVTGATEFDIYSNDGRIGTIDNGRLTELLDKINVGLDKNGIPNCFYAKDYGDFEPINCDTSKTNVLFTHGYFTFKNSELPNYGKSFELDNAAGWYGINSIIAGHIHNEHMIHGNISKQQEGGHYTALPCVIHYLPCHVRPSYHEDTVDMKGVYDIITINMDTKQVTIERKEFELLPVSECFNLEQIKAKKENAQELKERKEHNERVHEFSEVLKLSGNLQSLEPEEYISKLTTVEDRIKERALGYIKQATNMSRSNTNISDKQDDTVLDLSKSGF